MEISLGAAGFSCAVVSCGTSVVTEAVSVKVSADVSATGSVGCFSAVVFSKTIVFPAPHPVNRQAVSAKMLNLYFSLIIDPLFHNQYVITLFPLKKKALPI